MPDQPGFQANPIAGHRDHRGLVFEPVDAAWLAQQRNCHVVLTEPGAVRGNHWHRRTTEVAVLVGPGRVCVRDGAELREILVPDGELYRFVFPPGLPHAFHNPGTRPMLIVAFTDQTHDRTSPDVVSEVLIKPPGSPTVDDHGSA